MPYRLDIPGQVTEYQLRAIEAVASLAPVGGVVVEVGSLFGRSSFAWAKSVDPSVSVYCIDPWTTGGAPHAMSIQLGVDYSLEQFKRHVEDCDNIKPIVGYSPADMQGWKDKVDILYDDAVHTNPGFKENLDFWSRHLKPSSVVCGDDYRFRFPDVMTEAESLAENLGRRVIAVDNFWCALPGETDCPGVTRVEALLRELETEARTARASRNVRLSVSWSSPPTVVTKGEVLSLRGEIMYDGPVDVFPSSSNESAPVEVIAIARSRDTRVTVVSPLGADFLYHEAPMTIAVDVPTRGLKAGRVALDIRLKEPDGVHIVKGGGSFDLKGVRAARVEPLVSRFRRAGTYYTGTRIDFSVSGTGSSYTVEGWEPAAGQYSWASGNRGVLRLVPLPTGAMVSLPDYMRLEADVIIAPNAQNTAERNLSILVNDKQIWTGLCRNSCLISAPISREVWLLRSPVEIVFEEVEASNVSGPFAGLRSMKITF